MVLLLVTTAAFAGNEGGGQSGNGHEPGQAIPGISQGAAGSPTLPPRLGRPGFPKRAGCVSFLQLIEQSESYVEHSELESHCRNLLSR